jgi:hypothetical protein
MGAILPRDTHFYVEGRARVRHSVRVSYRRTEMAAEKLESWSFCLSRKPSRTGWDVETTRSGYGYENAKANVMMDYKGWYIVCSRKVR